MTRKISVSVALTIALIAITVTFAITWIVATEYFNNAVQSVTQKQATFSKLSEVDTYVRANYYGEINDTVLNDLIVQGYLRGIEDPYATYYTEKEYSELQEYEKGTRVGIGMEVSLNADGFFYIERVYEGSPAAKAGVKAGGRITYVDGIDAKTLTNLKAMTSLLRGEQGTTVNLTCVDAMNTEQKYEVQRINYTAPTVEYYECGDFGYIRISAFETNTYTELGNMVLAAVADGAQGLVFDVRGNPGGQYQQVYNIIDYLCPRGTIAKSVAKNGTTKVLATSGDERNIELPMTVLINENTEAAAELFAANIRDLAGGSVVGVTSAGKGMLQSPPQQLTDGSAISITTAMLLTGNDISFEGEGIVPDIEVPLQDTDQVNLYAPNPGQDAQILRALEVVRSAAGDNDLSIRYVREESSSAVEDGQESASVASDSLMEDETLGAADTGSVESEADSVASTSEAEEQSSSSSSRASPSRSAAGT
ncbi:PDZ domain-containing protein [Ruminococcaceae bacterium OttesenSCG-928-I18]|nr:PDZ domain-containing protein [Ruminococcaceae bacterium OttesenSCG-928-I18]